MKKNFAKTITLVLSCLLLIGAAIGISVSAEDAPTVSIAYKNLAYEAAPQLVYYVDAANLAEGDTAKVLFFDAEPAEVSVDAATYITESFGTLTVGEKAYAAFASDEIAPKNLRLALWAVPVVVNADGAIVAEGNAVKSSVFDYALARFNMAPTPDQLALYSALLDFGGALQEVLYAQGTYTEEELQKAGGFANAYYGVRNDVVYNGAVVEEGAVTYYKKGDVVTLTAEMSYNTYGIFKGFLDENNDLVAEGAYTKADVVAGKPGVAVYKSEYTVTGTIVNTYDNLPIEGDNNVNVKYKDKKGEDLKVGTGIHGVTTDTFGDAKDGAKYARIEKESEGSDNQVFTVGANGTAGGNAFAWTLDEIAVNADKYVFQTDFKWNGSDISTQPIYFRMDSTNITDDKCDIILFELKDSGAGYSFYTLDGYTLDKGQWYTMRVEIVPLSETNYDYYLYIDGVAAVTRTNITPSEKNAPIAANEVNKFIGFRMFNRKATNYSMEYDNTYVGVEYDEPAYVRGSGEYFNDETKVGTKYSYDGLEDVTTGNVMYSTNDNAAKNLSATDNSFYFDSADPNSAFGIKYDGETVSGNTYVFETDVYFGGGKTTKNYEQMAWVGLTGADGTGKNNHFLCIALVYNNVGDNMTSLIIRDYNSKTNIAIVSVGEWCNIRLVYTVNNTLNADGTVAENGYGGKVDVYVNNTYVKSYNTKGYNTSGIPAGSASNEKLTNVGFEMRSSQWGGITEVTWAFDNTYIGVLNVEAEAPEAE